MSAAPRPAHAAAAWLALAVGFSPVLVDLFRNVQGHPHDRCTLLAPLLVLLALPGRLGPNARRPAAGIALLGAGALCLLIGVTLDTWSLARLGLPLGVLGVAAWLGRPELRVAALAFWLVPMPDSLAAWPSPGWESRLAALGAATARVVGLSAVAEGPLVRTPYGVLGLTDTDWGYSAAFALSAVGWFAALRLGWSLVAGFAAAAGGAALGCLLQVAGVAVASVWIAADQPEHLAETGLRGGLWLLASLAGLAWVASRAPTRPQPGSGSRHPRAQGPDPAEVPADPGKPLPPSRNR